MSSRRPRHARLQFYSEQMLTVYFDFLCPYAWRGVELLSSLNLEFQPVHYSLVQGNHDDNKGLPRAEPSWKLVEQPLETENTYQHESLLAFIASHAASQQGSALHLAFILELFRLRHRDSRTLDPATILAAAGNAQLDLKRFAADQSNETARRADLKSDLERAGQLGVFGTPTIQFDDGAGAYFRFAKLPEGRSARVEAWTLFQDVMNSGAVIETIKRAKPGTKA